VRRYLLALSVLAAAAAAGAGVYTVYDTDREYSRAIAAGDQATAAEQPFQALEFYSGAIALRPDSMLAHLKRGMTYRGRGQLDEAMRDLRRAAALDPTATQPHELLGDCHLALRRYDRAAERYETFLRIDDRSARVWYKLGLARYRAGQAAAAMDPLRTAIALDASVPETYLLLGLALREQGEMSASRAALETAAQMSPGQTTPREALASVYLATGEPALAIEQLEALATLDTSRPERLIAVGLAHAGARRHEAAVLVLSRAVERFPADAQVYAALGHVWLEVAQARGDTVALKKALEALSTAASHSDVSSAALTDLGRASILNGDAIAAERAWRQAITRLPVDPEAYRQLATLAARARRFQEARDALVRYATLVGDAAPVADVALRIADYSLRLGDRPLALRWLERAEDDSGPTPATLALRDRLSR
jgi:tetratricopeptide (TPR) repeat protein